MTTTLVRFEAVKRALAEAHRIDEVKEIRDKAEALRLYVKQQGDGLEIQNDIAEIKLRAERRAGELLGEMEKAKGSAGQARGRDISGGIILEPPETDVLTLTDLGISKQQSHRWQLEAELPEEVFERHVAETKATKRELTSAGLYRLAQRSRLGEEAAATSLNVLDFAADGKYRVIVIDPPWPMQKILRDGRPNQDIMDYPTMAVDEIAKLPIADLANEDGCHIYLWTTHKRLPDALMLFRKWGVTYQCLMTWVKNTGMTPYSWMYSTEHVLFGRIGSLKLKRMGLRLDFKAKVRGHSRKPDIFYERVTEVSPGPRIDLFSREKREGFDQWGEESDRFK